MGVSRRQNLGEQHRRHAILRELRRLHVCRHLVDDVDGLGVSVASYDLIGHLCQVLIRLDRDHALGAHRGRNHREES